MKLCSLLAVLAAVGLSCQFATAEEKPGPFATISSTAVRGYIYTGTHWKQHICRQVIPVRPVRVVQLSTNGVPREVGQNVRCRHGMVFVPNANNVGVYPTPNRSSAFGISMRKGATPRPPVGQPPPPPPPLPERRPRSDRTNIVVFPPRPPRIITNLPPPIVTGSEEVREVFPPLRPPHVTTNLPPVVRPDDNAILIEANRQRSEIPNDRRTRPGLPPLPPAELTPAPQ